MIMKVAKKKREQKRRLRKDNDDYQESSKKDRLENKEVYILCSKRTLELLIFRFSLMDRCRLSDYFY